MAVVRVAICGQEIVVHNGQEEVLRLPLTDDLELAYNLMKKLSQMRTTRGMALHAYWQKDEIFYWPLYIEPFFWHALRPAIKYRQLLTWLLAQPEVKLKTELPDLAAVWGILHSKSPETVRNTRRQEIFDAFRFLFIASHDTFVACRMRLGKIQGIVFGAAHDNTCGRNFRLRDIYRELVLHKIRFVTCYLFSGLRRYMHFFRNSQEMAFYLPHTSGITARGTTHSLPDIESKSLSQIDPDLAAFLIPLVRHYGRIISSNISTQPLIRFLLRLSGVRWIVGIDDHSAHAGFLPACKDLGIKTIAVQTGPFRNLNIGWVCPGIPKAHCLGYDKMLVWSPYWRSLLARLSNNYIEQQLIPCGFIRPKSLDLKPKPKVLPHIPIRVLFAWEFLALPEETAKYLAAMLERGMEVTLKIRPDTSVDEQLKGLPRDRIKLLQNFHETSLADFDVCAGTFTTIMYELYHLGMPLWYLPMGHDFGHHIVEDGLAQVVSLAMLENPNFQPNEHLPLDNGSRKVVFGETPAPVYLAEYISRL